MSVDGYVFQTLAVTSSPLGALLYSIVPLLIAVPLVCVFSLGAKRVGTIVVGFVSLAFFAMLLPLGGHLHHSHPVVAFLVAYGIPGLCFGLVLAEVFLFRIYARIEKSMREKEQSRAHPSRPGLTGVGHQR